MERAYTHGAIKDNILEIGKIIKWTDMVFSLGLMEENMKENIKMIKNMDMDVFIGVMENNIKGIGKMGKRNNTFVNFEQNDYDFAELEEQLLDN